MRKLIETTFVSLDGVISDTIPSTAPHASPEKWGMHYWDEEHFGYAQNLLRTADALLLGRMTYEGFAASWPSRSGDPFSDKLNSMPKYVASRTLREPLTWNATLLKGDVAEAVAQLKAQPGGDILKYGTGELDQALMQRNLVDEFHFWFFPVLLGGGQQLIKGINTTHLKLINSTHFKSGIVVNAYAPK